MNEAYEGQQFVGIDLHRRRSVMVRMNESGELLECGADHQRRDRSGGGDGPGR